MISLYLRYFSIQIKSMLEYRKDFIISIFSQFFASVSSFLSIYFLFDRFGNIEGYTF